MKLYKTSDLYLAAYIKTLGKSLSGTERKGRKVYFCFYNVSEAIILSFYNNAMIGVTEYKDSLQNLKNLLYKTGV